MVNLEKRSRWRERFTGPTIENNAIKRSLQKNVLLVLATLVFICCMINLRLHSKALENRPYGVDQVKMAMPTWHPTISGLGESAWGVVYLNQSTRTYRGEAITSPNSDFHKPTDENARLYSDERPMLHPRVICISQDSGSSAKENDMKPEGNKKGTNIICDSLVVDMNTQKKMKKLSIPLEAKTFKADLVEEDAEKKYGENDNCKYLNETYRDAHVAPPTCNDIHSLGFDFHMFENRHQPSDRISFKYITMGGAKCIWKATSWNREETFILKSHKGSRFLKRHFWELSNRDALISGGSGNAQLTRMLESSNGVSDNISTWNHILPMYHYCGLANIVPYAANGNLMEYIHRYGEENGARFGPTDTLRLALQAARGLYEAQLYWDGKPTFVHADLNPSQFLVFMPYSHDGDKEESQTTLPILQINDFNQGRFLTRSLRTNEICPFRSCSKNQRGNRYHTPERFQGCVDQNDAIDTFSLGGVFFFILTSGFDPYYDSRNYYKPIKSGELPHIPRRLNLDHPAYSALKEVMNKCMTHKLNERPSTLEVVHMLEERLNWIEIHEHEGS